MSLADAQIREIINSVLDDAKQNLAARTMDFERVPATEQVRFLHKSGGQDAATDQEFWFLVAVCVGENKESVERVYELLRPH